MRIGILGAARIAPDAIVRPAAELDDVDVVAVAARDRGRAGAFASTWDIPVVADGYDALLERDDIDLVYIPLPVAHHHEWTLRAAQAGKHVLVEKAFSTDAEQATAMVDAGARAGVVVAEAYHYAYHPLIHRVIQLLESGAIGTVERVEADFHLDMFNVPAGVDMSVYTDPQLGGGALLHTACYCLHLCRTLLRMEPDGVSARGRRASSGVDAAVDATLRFGDVTAVARGSIDAAAPTLTSVVTGTDGSIELRRFVVPHARPDDPPLVVTTGAGAHAEPAGPGSTYWHQLRAVRDAVRDGTPLLTGGDAPVRSMRVLDAVRAAIATASTVEP